MYLKLTVITAHHSIGFFQLNYEQLELDTFIEMERVSFKFIF